ncbi:MAG: dTDP-4-dehydrorhamnose reductase, partial [Spirulinaceae cyanobacterium]
MKPIVLIGCKGQLGQELKFILEALGKREVISFDRATFDLSQPKEIANKLQETQPSLIINAAAYTAVDKAESEAELAYQINAIAPSIIAQEAQKLGAFLIHYSTDYVFDGKQGYPYQETDRTSPQSVYGESKLKGEVVIQANCDNHIIIRTAWVYGNYGKGNFVKTMLRLGKERKEIRVVTDQIGSPTWTKDLAETTVQ